MAFNFPRSEMGATRRAVHAGCQTLVPPHSSFLGQGLATEGSLAALEFGFCDLHLDTVVAFAVEANTSSRRVMEKVGVVYGRDFDHPSIPELSPLRHILYLLKRADCHEESSPSRILV